MKKFIGVVAEAVNPCLGCDSLEMTRAMRTVAEEDIARFRAQQLRRPDLRAMGTHAEALYERRMAAISSYAISKCPGITVRTTAYMTDAPETKPEAETEAKAEQEVSPLYVPQRRIEETEAICGNSEELVRLGITPERIRPVLARQMGMPEQA